MIPATYKFHPRRGAARLFTLMGGGKGKYPLHYRAGFRKGMLSKPLFNESPLEDWRDLSYSAESVRFETEKKGRARRASPRALS